MKYYVEIEGREYEVEIEGDSIRLDGRPVSVDLKKVGTHLWHLLVDGRSQTLRARRTVERGCWELEVTGRPLRSLALDERHRAIRELTGAGEAASGPYKVLAPMPGLIVAVEVRKDEVVEPGQGLVVIEAMKMENELKALGAGQVTDVLVAAGQAVNKGDLLVVIEPGD